MIQEIITDEEILGQRSDEIDNGETYAGKYIFIHYLQFFTSHIVIF